jgi:hypothetical protein
MKWTMAMLACVMMVGLATSAGFADDGDPHKREKLDLGEKKVGEYTVKATQYGKLKPGEETLFVVAPSGGAKPKAIRAWVGIESADGSAKAKAEEEEGEQHCHVEVPKPIPDKAQFWVELETEAGKKKVAFEYKK